MTVNDETLSFGLLIEKKRKKKKQQLEDVTTVISISQFVDTCIA